MAWDVEYTDDFGRWWNTLTVGEQKAIAKIVGLLEAKGPDLPFPFNSSVQGSRLGHLRELRVQHQGRPYRILYAFDPRRVALLLIGGDKTGNSRWYKKMIPVAKRLYEEHLQEIERHKRRR